MSRLSRIADRLFQYHISVPNIAVAKGRKLARYVIVQLPEQPAKLFVANKLAVTVKPVLMHFRNIPYKLLPGINNLVFDVFFCFVFHNNVLAVEI